MNINKKGYTLVELLVSIAIFSIVSIGIVSIMSNSVNAYKNSTLETEVQEEAQIVSNQLEELLCDAKEIDTTSEGYTFKSQGQKYLLAYDVSNPKNKKLRLKELNSSNAVTSDSVIAQNVSDFNLLGWDVLDDNKIDYTLTINEGSKSYTVSREIYFRNRTENNDAVNISYFTQNLSTTGTNPNSGVINVFFNRYDDLNLTTTYGINYLGNSTNKGGFKKSDGSFDNVTSNSYFNVASSNNTLTSEANDKVFVLTGTDTLNQTFNSGLAGNTVEFVGYKDSACTQKVTLNIDVKDIKINGKNVVYQHQYSQDSPTNNGIHTVIDVDGIDINKSLTQGVVIKYTPHLKNSTYTFNGTQNQLTNVDTVSKGENSIQLKAPGNNPGEMVNVYGNGELIMALQADPYGNGFIISTSNEVVASKCDTIINNGTDNTYELTFDLSINNGGVEQQFGDQLKCKFDVLGTGF